MNTQQRTNKIADITEKLIEANPDITKFQFGCKVECIKKTKNSRKGDKFVILRKDTKHNRLDCMSMNMKKFAVITLDNFQDHFKTIGRDIGLEDVIYTLLRTRNWTTLNIKSDVGEDIMFAVDIVDGWNFNHDLSKQPDETIKYIYDKIIK